MTYGSISEAAKVTGISARTIRRWVAEGRLSYALDTAERVGAGRRGYAIQESELAELIERLAVPVAKAPPRYRDGYETGFADGRDDREFDRPRFCEPGPAADQWARGYFAGYRDGYSQEKPCR